MFIIYTYYIYVFFATQEWVEGENKKKKTEQIRKLKLIEHFKIILKIDMD